MFKGFLILILKSIRYRPIRSWLTILGIVIGIMLVVIIFSLGGGIQNAVSRTLQMFGSDLVVILPGKETNPFVGFLGGQKFKEKDLMDLENIGGVKFVVPMEVSTLNIEYKGEKKSVMFHAQNWENYIEILESSQGVRLAEGRWPESNEAKEIVVASATASRLFEQKITIGDEVVVKSKKFKVVGILSAIGDQMIDNLMYISMEHFRELTGSRAGAGSAIVKLQPEYDVNLISKQIKFQLQKQETVRDFSILTPEKADKLVGNVLSIIELVLIVIALISLIVGAVGVMNTMYTSVLERTKQIGVMKAVGASSDAILSLFLIESGMIGLIGGVLGIIFGLILSYLISLIVANFGIRGLFSFSSVDFFGLFVILIITFITGIISGILPARRASRMEPAEALRYE